MGNLGFVNHGQTKRRANVIPMLMRLNQMKWRSSAVMFANVWVRGGVRPWMHGPEGADEGAGGAWVACFIYRRV